MNDIFNSFHLSPKDKEELTCSPVHSRDGDALSSTSSKGSMSKGLEGYLKQEKQVLRNPKNASTDVSPFSSSDGDDVDQENKLASFLEDDSNLAPAANKHKLELSTIDESLFSFISNPANFEDASTSILPAQSPIAQPQQVQTGTIKIKTSPENTELLESFITTCENLSHYLESDSLDSIDDFLVGSCFDVSKLGANEIIKMFQEAYGTGAIESKRRFSTFVTKQIVPMIDDLIQDNEQFIEETIKKEVRIY